MNSVQRLAGKVAIVTGGGDGIGKGICELFADEGARLAVIDMNDQTGSATVEQIRKAGGEAAFFHCDVGIEEDIAAMVEAVTGAFGGIDILINNAGVHLTKGTLETSTAEWERCHAVDLRGVWLCTKYCAPSMIATRQGRGGQHLQRPGRPDDEKLRRLRLRQSGRDRPDAATWRWTWRRTCA